MIAEKVAEQIAGRIETGLVFAAGGSADIILARTVAEGLMRRGCSRVDLAQPLNCKSLADKGLLGDQGRFYKLSPVAGIDPEEVLQHSGSVPSHRHPEHRRGKGLSISSSIEWPHGCRYVCAAHGNALAGLAGRRGGSGIMYDFAVGIDGGGDVLTHGEDEFDRVVVAAFRSGWTCERPLILVAVGLGGDGGSAPDAFQDATLPGWRAVATTVVDDAFTDVLQRELEKLGLWHPSPANWSKEDPYWGYGFKVPQIITMAVRREFPFPTEEGQPHHVLFPRRRELRLMDQRLLREARLYVSEGD